MAISRILVQHALAAAICLLGLGAVGGKRPAPDSAHTVLSFDGLGPVKVGMTVQEAEQPLESRLAPDRHYDPGECHYVQNQKELPGAAFLVLADRIVRADVYGPDPRTERGIQIGSTEDDVELAYPAVVIEPHPYVEGGHYLRVESDDGTRSMIIETDGEVVTSFRAGEREAVEAIEGCE